MEVTVEHLKKWLEKAPDKSKVVIDLEARTYHAHIHRLKGGYFESPENTLSKTGWFVLYPDYSGSEHVDTDYLKLQLTQLKQFAKEAIKVVDYYSRWDKLVKDGEGLEAIDTILASERAQRFQNSDLFKEVEKIVEE